MEMDKEVVFPYFRYDYSKCVSITQVMCWKNDTHKIQRNIGIGFDSSIA
jgi:hypothetical protein